MGPWCQETRRKQKKIVVHNKEALAYVLCTTIFFCFLLVCWHHGPTPLSTYVVNINERIAQGAADSWDQAARAVFVFLRCEHFRVFRCLAQILIFFKLKMASPAILFLEIPRQGQVVILLPAGLQIFPRRDALGLTRKWALRNNKRDVIIKTGQ